LSCGYADWPGRGLVCPRGVLAGQPRCGQPGSGDTVGLLWNVGAIGPSTTSAHAEAAGGSSAAVSPEEPHPYEMIASCGCSPHLAERSLSKVDHPRSGSTRVLILSDHTEPIGGPGLTDHQKPRLPVHPGGVKRSQGRALARDGLLLFIPLSRWLSPGERPRSPESRRRDCQPKSCCRRRPSRR
jgi:hypothetical protein